MALFSARDLASEPIQAAQQKYKKNYDRKTTVREYRIGDWVLIRFPQEETGAKWKLSRPWHGPYRVVASDDTGVTAVKAYAPQDNSIRVHQARVTRCPMGFPAGYYWYGNRRSGSGRPPKWIDQLVQNSDSLEATETEPLEQVGETLEEVGEPPQAETSQFVDESMELPPVPSRHTQTTTINHPERLML